jgi:endonuclease/exonuclease/phosphatase family metal-dependent hydrolase
MKISSLVFGIVVLLSISGMAEPQRHKPAPDSNRSTSKPVEKRPPMLELVGKMKIRVVSYNIEKGAQSSKVQENLLRTKADLILLQEVPQKLLRVYARLLGMSYHFGPYGQEGDVGIGVLARGQLEPVKLFSMEGERNYALAVKWTPADQMKSRDAERILVVCTHLKSLQRPVTTGLLNAMKPHTLQAKKILAQVKKQQLPTIVAGDFNTLSWTPEYRTMATEMKDVAALAKAQNQPTILVGGGGYRIDYFFLQGPWIVRDYEVSPKPGSDHRMIQTVLELPFQKALPSDRVRVAPVNSNPGKPETPRRHDSR